VFTLKINKSVEKIKHKQIKRISAVDLCLSFQFMRKFSTQSIQTSFLQTYTTPIKLNHKHSNSFSFSAEKSILLNLSNSSLKSLLLKNLKPKKQFLQFWTASIHHYLLVKILPKFLKYYSIATKENFFMPYPSKISNARTDSWKS
jgi:hypothetical protein